MTSSGTICSFSKPSAQMPMMKPSRLKVTAVSTRNASIQTGCAIRSGTNSAGRRQDDQPEDDRLGRGRADIAEHDLEERDRRRQELVDRSDEARKVDAERGVGDALRQQHQHDQARHDEGAVADALDLGDARADRRAEDHEIQRRREHRRDDALHQRAPGARHLEHVDRADRPEVHCPCLTRPTKMSSSELCVVCRSRNRMPARLRSLSSAVMPVRSPCVS